jgi:flagellar motor switch protein FliG
MTNEEKAAILLLALDEDLAAKVVKNLRPTEITRISRHMSRITNISSEEVNNVAKEFCTLARQKVGIMSIHDDLTRNIVVKALGEDKAHNILSAIEREGHFSEDNPVLEKLRDVDPQILREFTKTEHPQTIALILSHLRPEQAAEVMESLPAEIQGDIAKRMATLKSVPKEFIEEIANTLEQEIAVGGVSDHRPGGASMMAEILNRMNRTNEAAIMNILDEAVPGIATDIRRQMFTFDDVLKLDNRGMQELLREVTSEDLAKALKVVDEEMRGKVYRNMSKRGAEMLKEDIELMPPTRLSEVEKSQRIIIDVTKRLESEGRITLIRGEGGDELV